MSKIFTYWSVNGGVGKTTLSSVTSYNLAKKYPDKKVLLLDFNLVNPDTDYHLKCEPKDMKALHKYFVTKTMTEEVLMDQIVQYPRLENFHILSGLYDLTYFEKMVSEYFLIIIELAKKIGYDFIFIDIDSSINIDATFVALTNAEKIFIVSDGMYHTVRNTNRYIEDVLPKINVTDKEIELIVNKYDADISDKDELKKIFGRNDIHFIEFNKTVSIYINRGIPFVEAKDKNSRKLVSQLDEWTNYIINI